MDINYFNVSKRNDNYKKILIEKFKELFVQRKEIGNEYFNFTSFKIFISNYLFKEKKLEMNILKEVKLK